MGNWREGNRHIWRNGVAAHSRYFLSPALLAPDIRHPASARLARARKERESAGSHIDGAGSMAAVGGSAEYPPDWTRHEGPITFCGLHLHLLTKEPALTQRALSYRHLRGMLRGQRLALLGECDQAQRCGVAAKPSAPSAKPSRSNAIGRRFPESGARSSRGKSVDKIAKALPSRLAVSVCRGIRIILWPGKRIKVRVQRKSASHSSSSRNHPRLLPEVVTISVQGPAGTSAASTKRQEVRPLLFIPR